MEKSRRQEAGSGSGGSRCHLGARLRPRLISPGGSPGRGGRRSATGSTSSAPGGAAAGVGVAVGVGSLCPTAGYRQVCSPTASLRRRNALARAGTKFRGNLKGILQAPLWYCSLLKWGPRYCSLYPVFLCGSPLSFLCKLQVQLTSPTEELQLQLWLWHCMAWCIHLSSLTATGKIVNTGN